MKYIITIIFVFSLAFIKAQTVALEDSLPKSQQKNMISLGIGSAGLMAHANLSYERQIFCYEKSLLYTRLAYGKYVEWGDEGDLVILNWAYLFGKRNNHLEVDFGVYARISDIDVSYSTYKNHYLQSLILSP